MRTSALRLLLRRKLNAERALLELGELVPRARGLLELEIARELEHLLLECLDLARELLLAHGLVTRLLLRNPGIRSIVHAVDQVLDALDHACRRDVVALVVGLLLAAPAVRLGDRALDRAGDRVGLPECGA